MTAALITLLHLLVFAYWLGGDLGAFHASFVLADPKRSREARVAAAGGLANLDMAPRSALILALPTGLSAAAAAGWVAIPPLGLVAVWIIGLAWLALAWRLHLTHATPGSAWRTVDLALRWLLLTGLAAGGAAILLNIIDWPLFLGLKLLVLAACVALGLLVRRLLAPFGPAFGALASGVGTEEHDRTIAGAMAKVRPAVMAIWGLLVVAALLGLWRPQ